MNINKNVIDKLVQNNKNIASLMSSLGKLKEDDLKLILDEITKLKTKEPIKKAVDKNIDIDKKIVTSFSTLSKMVSRKPVVQKIKPITLIKNIVPTTKVNQNKEKQSSKNYTREDGSYNIQDEKLQVLKSIRDHLNTTKIIPEKSKDKISSGILGNISSGVLGGGIAGGVGGILAKGTTVIKKVGKFAGKLFPLAFALKSGYDLISGIKDGYSEYKKLKSSGDDTGASNIIFKTFIGSAGNLMGIVGSLIPGPIGWLLMGGSMLFDGIASNFDAVLADKSNEIIQGQQKVARINEMIDEGKENNILLLRPNIKNMSWEYKDYNTDSWKVIKDDSGNSISIASSRIQANDKSSNGIQTYKLKTEGKMLDLVLDKGTPKIKDSKGLREITPRKNGGSVNSGKDYLVGEKGPELYRTNSDNGLSDIFSGINKSFKKIILGFNVDDVVAFFTPQITTYKMIPGAGKATSDKQILDFSKMSVDSSTRFDSFVEQLFVFEGGYSDTKYDKGGKTKYGVTESTWKAFGSKVNPNVKNVADISKEDAKKVYQEQYYKNTIAATVTDPMAAYVLFDSNVLLGPPRTKMLWKKSGENVEKFLELRKKYHDDRVSKDPTQQKFLPGWTNRVEDIKSMISRGIQQSKIDSVKNTYKLTEEHTKNPVDKEFILNNIAESMADIVTKHFNRI